MIFFGQEMYIRLNLKFCLSNFSKMFFIKSPKKNGKPIDFPLVYFEPSEGKAKDAYSQIHIEKSIEISFFILLTSL